MSKTEPWLPIHQEILNECIKIQPLMPWGESIRKIIQMSAVDGDRYKRVKIIGIGKTYLVPISHIICYGLRAEEVPTKYKEAV